MIINSTVIPSDYFSLTGTNFVSEISELRGFNLFAPIYDDACDIGFPLRAKRPIPL